VELGECIFRNSYFCITKCECNKRLYRLITGGKKQFEECPYRSRTQIYKCEVYKKLNTIYKDILNKKFSLYLEIQKYLDLQYDIIKTFIEKIAEDYYIKHYQKKMVDKFIRDFRVKVGIAIANECYGQDGECPYFVIAKEIIKKP